MLFRSASAYVGPGLGLGAIAAIAGVLLSIVMAIVGVFWYPIKRLFGKGDKEEQNLEEADSQKVDSDQKIEQD